MKTIMKFISSAVSLLLSHSIYQSFQSLRTTARLFLLVMVRVSISMNFQYCFWMNYFFIHSHCLAVFPLSFKILVVVSIACFDRLLIPISLLAPGSDDDYSTFRKAS